MQSIFISLISFKLYEVNIHTCGSNEIKSDFLISMGIFFWPEKHLTFILDDRSIVFQTGWKVRFSVLDGNIADHYGRRYVWLADPDENLVFLILIRKPYVLQDMTNKFCWPEWWRWELFSQMKNILCWSLLKYGLFS